MKTQTIVQKLSLAFLFILMGSMAMAQTTDEEEARKQKEMKIKQEQLQKQQKEMKEQQIKMKEIELRYAEQARSSERARESARSRSFANVYTSGTDEGNYFIFSDAQDNQSQLTLRNSFDGKTDSSEGEFDVNESTSHIKCMINGKVRSGRITIKVLYPGGKVFKDLSITSSAEISFTQSLSIKEEDRKKYVGAWEYEVVADKAEGSYTLSFTTH